MTDKDRKIFEMRYHDLIENSIEQTENKYGEVFIRSKDGQAYLYNPKRGFIRKLPKDSNSMNDEELINEFSKRLKTRLKYAGMSQTELAEKVGVTRNMISRYVNGDSLPTFIILDRIARALNCSIDDFRYLD